MRARTALFVLGFGSLWFAASAAFFLILGSIAPRSAWTRPAVAATLQGGVTNTEDLPPLDPERYPNEDPLQERPVQMPKAVGGGQPPRCIPLAPNWQLLAQDQNECLWAVPVSEPGGGTVVDIKIVYEREREGERCGVDP